MHLFGRCARMSGALQKACFHAVGGDDRVQEYQDSLQFRAARDGGRDSSCVTAVRPQAQRVYESIDGQPPRF